MIVGECRPDKGEMEFIWYGADIKGISKMNALDKMIVADRTSKDLGRDISNNCINGQYVQIL